MCGYNRCIEALDLHHLDASKKEMALSSWTTAASFVKLATEASKCILVCACCHREIHAGVTNPPSSARRFDVDLYTTAINEAVSVRSDGIARRRQAARTPQALLAHKRVDWSKFDVVQMRASGMTLTCIAEKVGVTKAAVQKRLKKFGSIV